MKQNELDLIQQYLDGTIAEADFDRLQELLRHSAECRKALRDLATVDAKLMEMAAADPAMMPLLHYPLTQPAEAPVEQRWTNWIRWWTMAPLAAGLLLGALCSSALWAHVTKRNTISQVSGPVPVRAAVIGALTNTGLWDTISKRFEKATGRKVFVSYAGDRELCEETFRRGHADFLAVHGGDDAAKLISDGVGLNQHSWAFTEMVIAGPTADPAGIRGMASGAEALAKIASTHSPFFEFKGSGSTEVAQALWKTAGVGEPTGDWVLKDEADDKKAAMRFAEQHGAYLILGGLPIHSRKLRGGKMAILVQGDPAMRRNYVSVECNTQRFPEANAEGARALSQFLVSPEIQKLLNDFGAEDYGRAPFFPPVQPPGPGKLSLNGWVGKRIGPG
jgi:tungstate transport system substrate-binding protein